MTTNKETPKRKMTTLTKNTDKLRQEVASHVAADSIVQGTYWDEKANRGCFIGCLAKGDNPVINQTVYGLPVMVQRIAESIFEGLTLDEAKEFFAAFPDAVGYDGKDLSRVSWQFLAAELRSLPKQSSDIQAVIDPVIEGVNMLANGKSWPADVARAAAQAADRTARAAANAARAAARAAAQAADRTARAAANAARAAAQAADRTAVRAAAWAADDAVEAAAWAAAAAARSAAWAADDSVEAAARDADRTAQAVALAADDSAQAARLRQRDLLLRLISEAPVTELENHAN